MLDQLLDSGSLHVHRGSVVSLLICSSCHSPQSSWAMVYTMLVQQNTD